MCLRTTLRRAKLPKLRDYDSGAVCRCGRGSDDSMPCVTDGEPPGSKRKVAFPALRYAHPSGGLMGDGLERRETKPRRTGYGTTAVVKAKH